jgi:hypothetical protein
MLVASAVRFISICLLGFSRDITYEQWTNNWPIDALNINVAIGGSTAAVISLGLMALNVECFDTGDSHGNVFDDALSLQHLPSTMVPNASTHIEVEGERHDDHSSYCGVRFDTLNTSYERCLSRVYPHYSQLAFEITYLILGLGTPLRQHVFSHMYYQNGDCPERWAAFSQHVGGSCGSYQYGFAHVPWLRNNFLTSGTISTLATLYYFSFTRMILRLGTVLFFIFRSTS